MYTNTDCILNKRNELEAMIEIHNPTIIGIVELKPKKCRFELQACGPAVNRFQQSKHQDQGKGVCIVRSQIFILFFPHFASRHLLSSLE